MNNSLILPPRLADRPFSRPEGLAAGMTPRQLRSPFLHIPTRGARTLDPPIELVERAQAFATVLPTDSAFSHVTACALWRLPLPARTSTTLLHVMRPTDRAHVRRRMCVGHRGLETRTVEDLEGVRVVAPLDTWCDLAELSADVSLEDLVVVGDSIVNRLDDRSLDHPAFTDVLAGRTRPTGRSKLDAAVRLLRFGSRSPMETRTRLVFVQAGFPEPRLNVAIDDADGSWLLTGDLVWDEQKVVVEYQGSTHASRAEASKDFDRAGVAADHGNQLFMVFAEDIFESSRRQRMLLRVARALRLDPATLRIR